MYKRIKRFNTSPAVNKKVADLRADHVASLGLETGGTLGKIVTGVQDVRLRILSKTLNGVVHFVRFESKTREMIEFIASNGIN
ncbi:hypothetical protein PF010_g18031 [Phytophthora fragariae]|uniref:Uncharacterized protein n=1 Tax=Phytophthora fragariae TaxID=53985 RepID=A0A6A4CPA3_9STRA|nr:hypothetical protein PF009_g20020 [Phytophthora fragariae]KAE9091820.1 hypothetical protein PF007_g18741 [Phytophthora fragariae]KAE9091853.1 hypothetical protein PF010_g18031 [Phytophthora fragariae]KAE9294011.1 hypothetical protein PF001_g17991 [Phytophthora fragariae]